MKKISRTRNAQNYPKNSFFILSRWIFWQKSKNQNFTFLKEKKIKYFSRTPVQALEKCFFLNVK